MKKILIAGVGNIFNGDDAFGCEIVRQLKQGAVPEEVTITDFGIRSYDLAYALTTGFDVVILVDAAARKEAPGTVFLLEPQITRLDEFARESVDAHTMNPVAVLQMAQTLGNVTEKLYLVGCEPAVLETKDGQMGLSEPVARAVPEALNMIENLVNEILGRKDQSKTRLAAA